MHVPLEAESHLIFLHYFAIKVPDSMKNKFRGYYEEHVNNLLCFGEEIMVPRIIFKQLMLFYSWPLGGTPL